MCSLSNYIEEYKFIKYFFASDSLEVPKKNIHSIFGQRVKRGQRGSKERWVKGKGNKSQAYGIWTTSCTGKSNNCQFWNVSA